MATVVKKVKRAGKRASKYQFTANFQSIVVECVKEKWLPHELSVAWSRRGRRHYTNSRLWKASPDNRKRGVVVWPEVEEIEITVTLYKGQKDKKFELKEWEFAVIDTDASGKRKILATTSVNMADHASHLGLDKDLLLKLRPVSKKIRIVTLEVNLQSVFIKEGKATDDDMQSIASNLSYSKLSVIGVLEDDGSMDSRSRGGSFQDENSSSRPVTPVIPPALIESQDELIKWAKRMTVGYRGLKITNMTTSWRNGLGFLAIIHHFKPSMVDYDELSAINVKENNHLTCLLARELGISCTINPDHMINATVPDKLAIASFVYQLYSFFNDNIPSAVTPVSSIPMLPGNGMADFDKITMAKLNSESNLTNNPSDQPRASSDRLQRYSRHRLEDDNVDKQQSINNNDDTTATNGVATELFPTVRAPSSNGVDENISEEPLPNTDSTDEMFPRVGSSSAVKEEDAPTDEIAADNIPDVVVNSPTDNKSMLSRIRAKSPEEKVAIEKKITAEEMTEDVVIVRRERSSQPSVPEVPPDNGTSEDHGVINLDETVSEMTEAKKQPKPAENRRRKLPSLPNLDPNSEQRESLKQRAHEMLKQANEGSVSVPTQDEAREAELKERVQQMLHSGKPESTSAANKRIIRTGGVRVLGKAAPKPQIHVVQNTVVTQQQKVPDTSNSNSDSTPVNEKSTHDIIENAHKDSSEELQKDIPEKENEKEEVENENAEKEKENNDEPDGEVQRTAQPKKEPRKKRHHHMLSSEVKPVSKEPSESALKMTKQPPAEKPIPVPRTIPTPKTETVANEERDEEDIDNVNTTAVTDVHDEVCSTPPSSGAQSPDSMQSPSAWTSHTTDLAESILCSRSEFVVAELKQLQAKLKELDEKARLIELDLRNAMDQGNKEREERMMKEWFQLLNEKNDVIRRQMELNLIEKEEDVERKEYLLRRELRTLSGISDDIKTQDQKDKESKLLQELLKTVEERNNIEQRKMTTQTQKESEAAGFAKAQSRSSDLARNNPASNPNNNNNCTIS